MRKINPILILIQWLGIFFLISGILRFFYSFYATEFVHSIKAKEEFNTQNSFDINSFLWNRGYWAFGTYIAPRLDLPKSTLVVTCYQMLLGGIAMTVAGFIAGENAGDLFDATLSSWLWWVFLVLIGSIATYTAYLWLVGNAPVGLIATYAYVNPIIAVSLGVLFLEEKLSITLLLGAIVVIFGVFLVVRVEARSITKN